MCAMFFNTFNTIFGFTIVSLILLQNDLTESKSIPEGYYHSDVIVTKWPTESPLNKKTNLDGSENSSSQENKHEPGWWRKQLLKFGQVASKMGNVMGGHANKITAALDKICEVIKTVIPLLAAVCHVGEFGFCTATNEAPIRLAEAMNPNDLNLDTLDR